MQCPICHADMELYQEGDVQSKRKGISYKRRKYVCRKDDIWGRLEIPEKKLVNGEEKQMAHL